MYICIRICFRFGFLNLFGMWIFFFRLYFLLKLTSKVNVLKGKFLTLPFKRIKTHITEERIYNICEKRRQIGDQMVRLDPYARLKFHAFYEWVLMTNF